MKSIWKSSLVLPAALVLIGAVSSGQEMKTTQKVAAPESQPVWYPTKSKGQLCGHGTADRLELTDEKRAQWEAAVKEYNSAVEAAQKALLGKAGRVLSSEQAQAVQSWFTPEKAAANAPVRASGTVAQ